MQHISTDTKLKLVQMIRAESQENRQKMRSRESLLNYGYTFDEPKAAEGDGYSLAGMRLRMFLAAALFLSFFALDYTKAEVASVNSTKIVRVVEHNVDINAIDFIRDFTYTLSDNEE